MTDRGRRLPARLSFPSPWLPLSTDPSKRKLCHRDKARNKLNRTATTPYHYHYLYETEAAPLRIPSPGNLCFWKIKIELEPTQVKEVTSAWPCFPERSPRYLLSPTPANPLILFCIDLCAAPSPPLASSQWPRRAIIVHVMHDGGTDDKLLRLEVDRSSRGRGT